ncbi:MAG: hypothetical protein KDJ97_27220 [Anaerolineae bacterium]|nr:hypothetical protein [Anaerolineae bacterium]
MARLAAKEKTLFYPTPLDIVATIATNINPGPAEAILDPCCGDGQPLALLGERLGLRTYGNELHPQRFAEASTRLDYCLNGAREFLVTQGLFSVLLDNPPYDDSLTGDRMEVHHIRHDLTLLSPSGLGIWVIPETIIDFTLCNYLVSELTQVNMRRFPLPEYERFKQVVVFGIKRPMAATATYSLAIGLEKRLKQGLPTLKAHEFQYTVDESSEPVTTMRLEFPNLAHTLDDVITNGVHHHETWSALFEATGTGVGQFQPVLRLNSGHMALTIAAGVVDGLEVELDDQPHLIKGFTTKERSTTQETEVTDNGSKQTIRERERLVQTISAFNLNDGSLTVFDSLRDKDGFAQFLLDHQDLLVSTIEANHPPLFVPKRDMPVWLPKLQRVQAPGKLPGQQTVGGLLPAQQVRAAALAQCLQMNKSVILVGEMGSGKSAVSLAIAALVGRGHWKWVIVCPSQIVAKWKREAEAVLCNFGIVVTIVGERRKQPDGTGKLRKVGKPILDVINAMADPRPGILVVSYETVKNGPRWEHAAWIVRKPLKVRVKAVENLPHYPFRQEFEKEVYKLYRLLCCPDCGQAITDDQGIPITLAKNEITPADLAKHLGKKQRRCHCGAALWQQVPFAYGGRTAIADFLNRHYAGRYNLILDETHHAKGADTDAGYAAMDLVAGARRSVAMTGTLYSGKASSIFHLLFRLFPDFRKLYDYNEVQRFIEHHGLQETITTVKNSKTYHSTYGYTRENVRVRELPGVSPGMVTMLLNNTAFLKLSDMNLSLPEYKEERLPVPLDDRLQDGLSDIAAIYDSAVELAINGRSGLLSAWLYASLGWMDCPVTETLTARDEESNLLASHSIQGFLDSPDELLDEPLAKDQALVALIESELADGRGVGVYFAQVNRRDWMGRVQKHLEARGIYSEILRQSTCKPDQREAWYRKFVERCRARGQEPVLLSNGNLVKEGLDLIELPTLVETGIEYRINDLRQRDRRSWRLIQDKPVRVVFLYYEDSWQETALQLIAAKLKAALTVDGDLAEGLAAMDVDDGNLMDALMKAVSKGRRQRVEWSGMEIAAVATPKPASQPALLPDFPDRHETEVEIVQVELSGGAVQLSWGDLMEVATTNQSKSKNQSAPKTVRKVKVKGGEQLTFF